MLDELVLDGETDLPHSRSEAREVSQVVFSAAEKELQAGQV
jgi:hypothetical protein